MPEPGNSENNDGVSKGSWEATKLFIQGFWEAVELSIKGLSGPGYFFLALLVLLSLGLSCFSLFALPGESFTTPPYLGFLPTILFFCFIVFLALKADDILSKSKLDVSGSKQVGSGKNQVPPQPKINFSATQIQDTQKLLSAIAIATAKLLKLTLDKVRSNIFVEYEDGFLRMAPNCWYNVDQLGETTIRISKGYGATGACFSEKKLQIAVLKVTWGRHVLAKGELDKVDKKLRWIVSAPIPDFSKLGEVLGVLSVDGLETAKSEGELEVICNDVLLIAEKIGELINT